MAASAAGCAAPGAVQPLTLGSSVRFPEPPDPPRIVYLTTLEEAIGETHTTSAFERFLFGETPATGSAIITPFGIAAWQDQVLVCDTQKNLVHCFDLGERRRKVLGSGGAGRLSEPVDVAVAEDGTRYVADSRLGQVLEFDAEDRFVRNVCKSDEGEFRPVSVAVRGDALYVANVAQQRIEIYGRDDGALRATIGGKGEGSGQFRDPTGVEVDGEGRVYVTDALRARVQVFDPAGAHLRTFGQPGQTAGCMARPRRIAVSRDGISYVADAVFHHVHMFDDQGRILMLFGGADDAPGCTRIPADVCISEELLSFFGPYVPEGFQAEYMVLVTSQLGPGKVNVYAFGQSVEPVATAPIAAAP